MNIKTERSNCAATESSINTCTPHTLFYENSPQIIVPNMLNCDNVVSDFELQSEN